MVFVVVVRLSSWTNGLGLLPDLFWGYMYFCFKIRV